MSPLCKAARSSATRPSRSTECSSRAWSYMATAPRVPLASYKATSARLSSRSWSRPSRGASATPTLPPTDSSASEIAKETSNADRTRAAASIAAVASPAWKARMANYSPPGRGAEARHEVAFTDRPAQSPGNLDKQQVACVVTQRVVDLLEVVEVEQHHRERS